MTRIDLRKRIIPRKRTEVGRGKLLSHCVAYARRGQYTHIMRECACRTRVATVRGEWDGRGRTCGSERINKRIKRGKSNNDNRCDTYITYMVTLKNTIGNRGSRRTVVFIVSVRLRKKIDRLRDIVRMGALHNVHRKMSSGAAHRAR